MAFTCALGCTPYLLTYQQYRGITRERRAVLAGPVVAPPSYVRGASLAVRFEVALRLSRLTLGSRYVPLVCWWCYFKDAAPVGGLARGTLPPWTPQTYGNEFYFSKRKLKKVSFFLVTH